MIQNPKLTLGNFILLFYGKFRLLVTMDACLTGRAHYLDISNEISVLQTAQSRHHKAKENDVSISGPYATEGSCVGTLLG